MDLLSSLGLGDALPEQSTRLASHPGVARALDSRADVRIGFNACLRCGSALDATRAKQISCRACRRVAYCSISCRGADAEPSREGGRDGAPGHSPVVCALLRLCNDDEDAEDQLAGSNGNNNDDDDDDDDKKAAPVDQKMEAARYRVRTELESYPATLFNVLAEGPGWFVEAMSRRIRYMEDPISPEPKRQRRGKRDRTSLLREQLPSQKAKKELVLHIVGASADSELWGWDGTTTHAAEKLHRKDENDSSVLDAYAEAASNLTSHLQSLLEINASISIRCVFVGPDCPKSSGNIVEVPIPGSKGSSMLRIEIHCCKGEEAGDRSKRPPPAPDAVVFFNPGFSCPDYDWSPALTATVRRRSSSSTAGPIPFLLTTNTEMEAFADVQYLLDGGHVNAQTLPNDVLAAADRPTHEEGEDDDARVAFFFGPNPYAGLRVRQSGTMGNDLYVKSRWIVGGLLHGGPPSQKKKQRDENGQSGGGGAGEEERVRKKRRGERGGARGGGNTKRKNPALI